MSIETLLQECADRGMTHLTVYPVHSNDRKTVYWHAKATPSTDHTGSAFTGEDISEVVKAALTNMPRAPKRKPRFDSVNPPLSELAQREVTAAVTEPKMTNGSELEQYFEGVKENLEEDWKLKA